MRYYQPLLLTLLFAGFPLMILAQTTHTSPVGIGLSGGTVDVGDHVLRYSVGEPVISTWTIQAGELKQGFQQATLSPLTSVSYGASSLHRVVVYPQPVKDLLTLDWQGKEVFAGALHWHDLNGREITGMTQAVYLLPGETRNISVTRLPAGPYLLIITGDQGVPVGSWKVIRLP